MNDRALYYYNARPHPSEVQAAEIELKRGIDDDWKSSVQRYPEVLEYFYGLVDLNLPGDDEPGVRDPPLSALGGVGAGRERKVRLREPLVERERERDSHRHERRRSLGRRERERQVAPPPPLLRVPSRPATAFAPESGYGYVGPARY
jgi:hypothetical protein